MSQTGIPSANKLPALHCNGLIPITPTDKHIPSGVKIVKTTIYVHLGCYIDCGISRVSIRVKFRIKFIIKDTVILRSNGKIPILVAYEGCKRILIFLNDISIS